MAAAAHPAHAVQLSTAGVLAHHHRRRILLVRGAIPDRHRARDGAAARGGDPHGPRARDAAVPRPRSEEHTSELQSHSDLVCRLLLEKKKTKITNMPNPTSLNRPDLH